MRKPVFCSVRLARDCRFGPQGVLGGCNGDVNKVVVLRQGETYVPLHLSKEQDIALAPGDRVWVRTPGGGGYGDPLEREANAVFEDVRLGRYTADQAAKLYGVIVGTDGDGELSVDSQATATRRAAMKGADKG